MFLYFPVDTLKEYNNTADEVMNGLPGGGVPVQGDPTKTSQVTVVDTSTGKPEPEKKEEAPELKTELTPEKVREYVNALNVKQGMDYLGFAKDVVGISNYNMGFIEGFDKNNNFLQATSDLHESKRQSLRSLYKSLAIKSSMGDQAATQMLPAALESIHKEDKSSISFEASRYVVENPEYFTPAAVASARSHINSNYGRYGEEDSLLKMSSSIMNVLNAYGIDMTAQLGKTAEAIKLLEGSETFKKYALDAKTKLISAFGTEEPFKNELNANLPFQLEQNTKALEDIDTALQSHPNDSKLIEQRNKLRQIRYDLMVKFSEEYEQEHNKFMRFNPEGKK